MEGAPQAARRFWVLLWALAFGLLMLLLFATLADRPFRPEALQHFSAGVLSRGRQFTREVRVVATLRSMAYWGSLLLLCFSSIGVRILRWFERAGRGRFWLELAAVAFGVGALTTAVELPFDFYLGYWHERAYDLVRITPGQWLGDYLTGFLVNLFLGLLFLLPFYWLIRRWPRRWWIPAALLNVALTGILVVISPILLMPLFNKIVPVRDPKVEAMAQRLADRAGVEIDTVQEMLVSEKSSRVNAMVTGLGPTKRVIVYDTLLQQFKPEEVEVVMAHELSHAMNRDVATGWLLSGAAEVLTLCMAAWMLRAMTGVGPLVLEGPHAARGLAAMVLLMSLASYVTSPVQNYVSRRMEVRADRFALEITGKSAAFISGFKKLASGNPGDVDPSPIVEWLSHSHPSITSRIRAAVEFKR